MVIDYLNRLESLDFDSLKIQDRRDIIMTLGYLEKRERNPELSREIKNQLVKLMPQEQPNRPKYNWT